MKTDLLSRRGFAGVLGAAIGATLLERRLAAAAETGVPAGTVRGARRPRAPEREREPLRTVGKGPARDRALGRHRASLPRCPRGIAEEGDRVAARRPARPGRPGMRLVPDPANGRLGVPRSGPEGRRGGADFRSGARLRRRDARGTGEGAADVRFPARPRKDGRRVRRAHGPRVRVQPEQPDRNDRVRRRAGGLPHARPPDDDGPRRRGVPPLRRGRAVPNRDRHAPPAPESRRREDVLENLRPRRNAPRIRGRLPRPDREAQLVRFLGQRQRARSFRPRP